MTEEEIKEPEMTEEEAQQELQNLLGTAPMAEQSHSTHAFLQNVAEADDTTKVGFLTEDEIGAPRLPIRTLKELAVFCKDVANMEYYSTYLDAKAEVMTSTSLSKNAKLLDLAVLQRRELKSVSDIQPRKENKGWFKKKNKNSEYG